MYEELDRRIQSAIERIANPIYDSGVCEEAGRLAQGSGREPFRVIDGRLQALRRAGRIKWVRKAEAAKDSGQAGWRLAAPLVAPLAASECS